MSRWRDVVLIVPYVLFIFISIFLLGLYYLGVTLIRKLRKKRGEGVYSVYE